MKNKILSTLPALIPAALLAVVCSMAIQCNHLQTETVHAVSAVESWHCKTIADAPISAASVIDSTDGQQRAVAYKGKFWPNGYAFAVYLDNPTPEQRALFEQAAKEWERVANVRFTYPIATAYDIRVTFNPNGGAWSYVGTDCKLITAPNATMNLGWLAKDAYLHEIGHTLGLLHEHQNPNSPIKWNEAQVIKDLSGPPNNWDLNTIRFNVLNPYPLPNTITTALDRLSIMMYPIPSSWTLDGFTTNGGQTISSADAEFIALQYPKSNTPNNPPINPGDIVITAQQADSINRYLEALLRAANNNAANIRKSNVGIKKIINR